MRARPASLIRSVHALFFLNTAIWAVLGIFTIARLPNHSSEEVFAAWIVAMLMFGNAAAMLISGLVVARPGKLGYAFALTVLVVNILLTFTDQVGTLDLLTLLIDLVLLILLIYSRRRVSQNIE